MWVTRDANQHVICAASAQKGLPFARTASSAGRVMRSSTLLLLAFAATAASANYTHHSIPEICASQKRVVKIEEAALLTLWPEHNHAAASNSTCQIELKAKQGHFLSIAYVSFANQSHDCPLKVDLHHWKEQFNASLLDLCGQQREQHSTLPYMMLGKLTLVVRAGGEGWAPPGHSVVATAIGLENTCLNKQRYFPCVMMDTPRTDITTHLKFCVPQGVVCDGILNCPASGADEIPLLCGHPNDSSSKVTEQLRRLSEKTHLDLYNNMSHVPYDDQPISDGMTLWWLVGAAGVLLSLISASVMVVSYMDRWNKPETERQLALSPSEHASSSSPEEPPPDYKTIFPAAEAEV